MGLGLAAAPLLTGTLAGALSSQHREVHTEIKRIGSQPSRKGPAEWFTGMVRIDPLFLGEAPARPAGASVTFEPGARTAWHTHPLGQTLIITAGCGWVQRMGVPGRFLRLHLLVCAYRVIGATWIRAGS